jgi:diguanylate cyclase (GGDEF)-like protein
MITSIITKAKLDNTISSINEYEKTQAIKNVNDKLTLINTLLNNKYQILKETSYNNAVSSLKATVNSINKMLNEFKTLHFKNYFTYMNMYLTRLDYDIITIKNGKIFNSDDLLEIGNLYTLPCDPIKNYGECQTYDNPFTFVKYNPSYQLFIVGQIAPKTQKEEIKNELLNILKTIPNVKIFKELPQDNSYLIKIFEPLNIVYGIKLNYNEIAKTSKQLSQNLLQNLKHSAIIYVVIFVLFFIINYLFYRYFKNKIDLVDKIFKEYKIKATNDKLTGFLNRGAFENKSSANCEALLILDLDNFKYINDTFGHDRGDKVLKEFSFLLQKYFKNDIIGRWGGDEFLICTDKDKNLIYDIAKHINLDLIKIQKSFDTKIDKQLSLSIGACKNKENFEAKFKKADLALYKSKKSGKGKVIFYEDLDYIKMEKEDF